MAFTVFLVLLNVYLAFCATTNKTAPYLAKCEEPTVVKCNLFNQSEDAQVIKRSLKYTYNAETTLLLLLNRANSQRQEIEVYLRKHHDINLIAELEPLFPPFASTGKLLKALISEPKDFLAISLFEALNGPGTNEGVLIEVLCSGKSNEEINDIKYAFKKRYGQSLKEKVYGDTSGDFMNLLLDILHGGRKPESTPIDDHMTKKLINLIFSSKTQNRLFESSVVTIFSRESFKQLYHIIANFSRITAQTIHQCIAEIPGNQHYTDSLLAIVDSVLNLPRYYARKLYAAMEGLGTDDEALIRIITIRSEHDMGCIKREFEDLYGVTLKSRIQQDTFGSFSEALIQLIDDKKPINCTAYPFS